MQTSTGEQIEERRPHGEIEAKNLPVVNEDSASPEVKQLYQQFREDFGRAEVPGILGCFATHPPLLVAMMGLAKSMLFVDGALGRERKEMISTFVSGTNRCEYCADSHAYSFRMNGGSAEVLRALLACDPDASDLKAEKRTLLRFVKKVNEDSSAIAPSDMEAMREAGWSDLQIAEAIHVTALFASFNRIVNAFGLPSQEMQKLFERAAQQAEDFAGHA
jgi:uncharacterized peroxidase-related enzyme